MDSTNLEILLTLKDEASAQFKKAGDAITSTGDKIKKGLNTNVTSFVRWGAAAGVAAGGLAVAFGVSAVKSYGEAQASLARIEATLNAMGPSAIKSKDAILQAAAAAVKLGFDDEAAAESITRFYQATNDLTKAQDLNNLAMDLARAKNIDLSAAAGLVNQVLSGNGRVLKQYQIALDETKTPLEQLGELQTKVAGQGEAFATTWPGLIATVTETWSNMKDEIGKVLVEALTPFVKQFTAWLTDPKTQESFKHWTEEFKSWAEVIIPVLIDTFKLWFDVLKTVLSVMLEIGEAIIAAVDAAKDLSKYVGNRLFGGGRAAGGPVSGGTTYLVGESGPELFTPSSSGSIIPNSQLRGGGGIVVNINGGYFLSEDVAERLGDLIIKRLGMSNSISA